MSRSINLLQRLHAEAVKLLQDAGNETWLENAFLPSDYSDEREAFRALRQLVVRHLLREVGDAGSAAEILYALHEHGVPEDYGELFFRLLCRFVSSGLDATTPRPWIWARNPQSVLSAAVWGADYIERFDRCCIASLAARGNIPALRARGAVELLIHTSRQDVPKLRRLESLKRLGVKIRYWMIPDKLVELATAGEKYWLLGGIQSIHLSYAARRRANFFPIFPDGFYSERYFDNMLEIAEGGVDAVLLSSFKAMRHGVMNAARGFLESGGYAVPSKELVGLALKYIDSFTLGSFINARSDMLPRRRMLLARSPNYIEIRSPHYNVALLKGSATHRIQPRYFMSLDSEIDKLVPTELKIHLRDVNDDYFGTELVDDDGRPPPQLNYEDYASFFVELANRAHLRFYDLPYRIGMPREGFERFPSDAVERIDASFRKARALIASQMEETAQKHHRWGESVLDRWRRGEE